MSSSLASLPQNAVHTPGLVRGLRSDEEPVLVNSSRGFPRFGEFGSVFEDRVRANDGERSQCGARADLRALRQRDQQDGLGARKLGRSDARKGFLVSHDAAPVLAPPVTRESIQATRSVSRNRARRFESRIYGTPARLMADQKAVLSEKPRRDIASPVWKMRPVERAGACDCFLVTSFSTPLNK